MALTQFSIWKREICNKVPEGADISPFAKRDPAPGQCSSRLISVLMLMLRLVVGRSLPEEEKFPDQDDRHDSRSND